jgi:hypothetical protein
MKYIKILFFLLLSSAIFVSCEKENDEPSDKELPTITKISPQYAHQAYDFGDTAYFIVEFKDNVSLKEASVRLYLETEETILNIQKFPDAANYRIDTFVIMNDPRFSDLNFDIKAIDASGNVALQSSHIHLR